MNKSMDSSWGHIGGIGKDPQRKRIPRTWTKKKVSFEVKPFQKVMNKKVKDKISNKQVWIGYSKKSKPLGNINKGIRYGGL